MKKIKIYHCDQGTDEWLSVRLGKITGSEAYKLLMSGKGVKESVTKIKYAQKIAYERLFGVAIKKDISYIQAVKHGLEYEDFAVQAYENKLKVNVQKIGFLELDEEYDFEENLIGCSPDGLVGDDGMIEIKCPNQEKHLDMFFDGLTDNEWITQCKFNLFVCQRKWIDFVSYDPFQEVEKLKIYIQRIERDQEWENNLIQSIESFKLIINEQKEKLNHYLKRKN